MKSSKQIFRKKATAANERPGDFQELPAAHAASNQPSGDGKSARATSTVGTVDLKKLNTPLVASVYEQPNPVGKKEAPSWFRDVVSLLVFIAVILVGAWLINHFVFQSFNVVGPSMEPTLEGENGVSDRLIVNRLPLTAAALSGKQYVPNRGDIIVFRNPLHGSTNAGDEYIVKRVIGLPGERVVVSDCELTVYNSQHPEGFDPYDSFTNLADNDAEYNQCVNGDGTDVTVPDDEIFVVGDHREGNYSMDSRNGGGRASLGTIPLDDIVGPVAMRIWPLNKVTLF